MKFMKDVMLTTFGDTNVVDMGEPVVITSDDRILCGSCVDIQDNIMTLHTFDRKTECVDLSKKDIKIESFNLYCHSVFLPNGKEDGSAQVQLFAGDRCSLTLSHGNKLETIFVGKREANERVIIYCKNGDCMFCIRKENIQSCTIINDN